jgi:hypothetical protein
MEYHILKRGRPEGPYSEDEIYRMIGEGDLSRHDLAQTPTSYYWMPLHRLLEANSEQEETVVAPEFTEFLREIYNLTKSLFEHWPLPAGLLCLGVGFIVTLLSLTHLPVIMYGPWLLGALIAGAILVVRGRTPAGVLVSLGAILIPILLSQFFH